MDTKKCKFCQEEIDKKATRCPKCQGDLRSWFARHPIITGIAVLFVIVLILSGSGSSKNTNTTSSTGNTNESSSQPAAAQQQEDVQAKVEEDPNPHFSDGTYIVGKDIQPGTYRTRKLALNCYYARLSGLSGSLNEILANENTTYPSVITIEEGDKAFKSSGCGTWTQDLSAITESKTAFGDGIFIVGTDIESGTYRNKGQTGCYYARLSNFSGGLGGILANEMTDNQAIVTIKTADKGFKSSRCGTWEKVE